MTARRTAATLAAAALLLGGLSACTDADSSTATPDSRADARQCRGRPRGDPGPEADDPALDPAVNEPLEDSVYPDVGDPSVDSLHYGLDLTWDPETRTLDGVEQLTFRSTGDADHVQLDLEPQLEVSAVQVDDADADFSHDGKDLVVSGDFAADERYVLTVLYSGSPEPVEAPTTRRRLQHHRLHGDAERRGLDDAGALRRLHLVRRQRPALRQGVLRLHADHAVAVGGRGQRGADQPRGSGRQHRHRPGTSTAARRPTW